MYVYIYIYIHTYIHTYIHIYIYMYTHTYDVQFSTRWREVERVRDPCIHTSVDPQIRRLINTSVAPVTSTHVHA